MATLDLTNQPMLFSDNAGQLDYALSDGEVIYVVISGNAYKIPVTDSEGELDLSDILREAPIRYIAATEQGIEGGNCRITAGPEDLSDNTGRANVYLLTSRGGVYGLTAGQAYNQFAGSPMMFRWVRTTTKWGKEMVMFLCSNDYSSVDVVAEVRLSSGQTVTVKLADYGGVGVGRGYRLNMDASFSRIAALVEQSTGVDLSELIFEWDVKYRSYAAVDGTILFNSNEVRYTLAASKANYRGFLFRGSLGSPETLYSCGTFRVVPKYDFSSFLNRNTEGQSNGSMTEHMEISTGPITDNLEERLWLDMLRSDEVYMVDQSGDARLIIIDEASPSLEQKSLNSLSFKCHFADRPVGNGMPLIS